MLGLCAGVGILGIAAQLAGVDPWPAARAQAAQLSAIRERDRAAIASLREHSDAHLDALALRLGSLQARTYRLEALAADLAQSSGIDPKELQMDASPGMGGVRQADVDPGKWSFADLDTRINELEQQFNGEQARMDLVRAAVRGRQMVRRHTPSGRPIASGWMSSRFGRRTDPFNGKPDWHGGLDFAGKMGTPVLAVADGVVTWARNRFGYGLMVEIDHGNGYLTRYAHLSHADVSAGDRIRAGHSVGEMGSSGHSTGPHVHFEVLEDGKRVNPIRFVQAVSRRS